MNRLEQKMSDNNNLLNLVKTYPITNEGKLIETNIIKSIL
jgi:hypothetical protein